MVSGKRAKAQRETVLRAKMGPARVEVCDQCGTQGSGLEILHWERGWCRPREDGGTNAVKLRVPNWYRWRCPACIDAAAAEQKRLRPVTGKMSVEPDSLQRCESCGYSHPAKYMFHPVSGWVLSRTAGGTHALRLREIDLTTWRCRGCYEEMAVAWARARELEKAARYVAGDLDDEEIDDPSATDELEIEER